MTERIETALAATDLQLELGAHQAAAALIIEGDWTSMRKYFSLSPRYAAWYDYRTSAVGFGIHADVVKQNVPISLTQAELARLRNAARQASPDARLALPLLGQDGATMVYCSSRISTRIRTLPGKTRRS